MSDDKRVMLLLEGTYPYVRGGVSSWVHEIINGLPDYNFELFFIGGSRQHYGELQYELPKNVLNLELHYLEDAWALSKGVRQQGPRKHFEASECYHEQMRDSSELDPGVVQNLINLVVADKPAISHRDFLFSRSSWDSIVGSYEQHCNDPNFLKLLLDCSFNSCTRVYVGAARAKYQTAKNHPFDLNGYAGMFGAMLKTRHPEISYILSEHGIYTKERKIDLSQAEWIQDGVSQLEVGLTEDAGYIRRLWIRFYQQIGRMTYEQSDPIVSLYEGNRERQVTDGARRDRTMVIPNGISLTKYADAMDKRPEKIPMVVGFIGRVVPIKDVKTFIRAMRGVVSEIQKLRPGSLAQRKRIKVTLMNAQRSPRG